MSDGDAGVCGDVNEDLLEERSDDSEKKEAVARLPSNLYGDVLLTMVTVADKHNPLQSEHPRVSMLVSLLLFGLSLFLQFGLSLVLYYCVIHKSVAQYEFETEDMSKLLDASNTTSPVGQTALMLCKRNTVRLLAVYPLVLLVWFTRIIADIAQALWTGLIVYNTPVHIPFNDELESPRNLLHPEYEVDCDRMIVIGGPRTDLKFHIQALTPQARWCALGVVVMPKFVLICWIAYVGAAFLLYASESKSLILKALALQMFLAINEQFFKSFVSEDKKGRVARTTIAHGAHLSKDWNNYGSTLARLVTVLAMLVIFYWGIHWQVHQFRVSCWNYKLHHPAENPDFMMEGTFEEFVSSMFEA